MKTKIKLAEGTHAHVLESPVKVKPDYITISGNAPLSDFVLNLPRPSVVKHEIPVKGHSQVRVPHGEVYLQPGLHGRFIAHEFNPFTRESIENYD